MNIWIPISCTIYGMLIGMAATLLVLAQLDVRRARRTAAAIKTMAE